MDGLLTKHLALAAGREESFRIFHLFVWVIKFTLRLIGKAVRSVEVVVRAIRCVVWAIGCVLSPIVVVVGTIGFIVVGGFVHPVWRGAMAVGEQEVGKIRKRPEERAVVVFTDSAKELTLQGCRGGHLRREV